MQDEKNINIACLTHEYPPIGGGGSTTVQGINSKLSQLGYNINVLTMGFNKIPKNEKIGNINIERLNCHRTEQPKSSLLSLMSYTLSSTYTSLKKYGENDIIHSYFMLPAGIPGFFLKKKTDVPLVVTALGADVYDPTRYNTERKIINKLITKSILKSADRVTAISHDLASRIEKIYDVDVEIVHTGVDTEMYQPNDTELIKRNIKLDTNKIHLLSVGRLVKRNGFDNLLYALEKVVREYNDVELHIIGHGPEINKLTEIINKLSLQNNVSLVGFVDQKLLIKYYQACDIFVYPALHSGQGCVVLEAMSCGKPIVTGDDSGQVESVTNNYNGLLIPITSSTKMCEALLNLIEDKSLRATMGKRSRKIAVENFDWNILAEQISKIYSELI